LSRTCSEDELVTLIGEEVENLPNTTNLPGYRCYNKVRAHHMFSRILKLQINEKKPRNCRLFWSVLNGFFDKDNSYIVI
jgi:hypothetical protein